MGLQPGVEQQPRGLYLPASARVSQKAEYKNCTGSWEEYLRVSFSHCTLAFLSNAFGAICMALPTMPAAVMLLQLGSLSNLMMTNTAAFLICSLPKKNPNNYLGEKKKSYLSSFPPPSFFSCFFSYLKKAWEEGTGRMGSLGKGWS